MTGRLFDFIHDSDGKAWKNRNGTDCRDLKADNHRHIMHGSILFILSILVPNSTRKMYFDFDSDWSGI